MVHIELCHDELKVEVLEKSRLTHSFTLLASAISASFIAIKSSRCSCEAKMVKLLFKLIAKIQERISVKEGD